MSIDMQYQLELLQEMKAEHPRGIQYGPAPDEVSKLAANLLYLTDHGLCDGGIQVGPDGHIHFGMTRITAAGLDFLSEDGGLSAILGIVTIKLHADTVRDLIAAKVDAAPIPVEEKSALKQHLAALSEAGLKSIVTDLVKTGLDHLPDAIHWLRTLGGL
jgi:hypothetical protein